MDGFNVNEPVDVQDLAEVKEERSLTPPAKVVKVRISKAAVQTTQDKDIKSLKLELRIADGIPMVNKESGETEMRYQNKPLFTGIMDIVIWADLSVKERSTKDWWNKKQHLIGLKQFCQALDIPLTGLQVNDEFISSLIGRELAVDIQHEEETVLNEQGKREKTGTYRERLRNWKKIA